MELDYFIEQSSRAQASVKDKWLDGSSLILLDFGGAKSYNFTGISGNSDFSLYFSFERKMNSGECFFSNITESGGFAVLFNNNNQLSLYTHYPEPECYTFDVNLGIKNCLALIKNDSQVSLLNYDLDAQDIYQIDSHNFTRAEISGGAYTLGFKSDIFSRLGMSGISGAFDQMCVFNRALDIEDSLTVFSGFLPIQKTSTTVFTNKYYSEYSLTLKPSSIFSENQAASFIPFLNYVETGIIPFSTGNYTALISGDGNGFLSQINWSGFYGSGNNNCLFTGVPVHVTGAFNEFNTTASGIIYFVDQFYSSLNENSERVGSHLVSFYTNLAPNIDDYFSYNTVSKYRDETTVTFSNPTGSYISGFYMNGVVIDRKYCNLMRYNGKTFKDVGIDLPFDSSSQLFMTVDGFSDMYNLYWGFEKISAFSISGIYVTTEQVEENNDYRMVFDKSVSDPYFVHANFGFATGVYPRGASVVLGGNTLSHVSFRMPKREIIETSYYHLIHGKKDHITLGELSGVYVNSEDNWV